MGSGTLGDSGMIALTAKIIMGVIAFLFFVVVFMFFLHLYAKWFWSYQQEDANGGTRRRRRRRLDFAGGHQVVNVHRRGLDPSILKTIPVVPFNTKEFKDGLECSVCLSEVSEGEKARVLPKCNHGFHVDCIDMWFQSHSTCPLCRNPVSELSNSTMAAESAPHTIAIPVEEDSASTNLHSTRDETQVSTLGPCLEVPTSSASARNRPDGILVIDIPTQTTEQQEEEQKTPTSTRLRSLTRLFSRVNPCSPRNVDVEQGSREQR